MGGPVGDPEVTAVARVAAELTGMAVACVTVLDGDDLLRVASTGDGPLRPTWERLALVDTPCELTVTSARSVHVANAAADPVLRRSPLVDGRLAAVRGYASVPLTAADGRVLGTLCTMDEAPRTLTAARLGALEDLGAVVVALLARRRDALRSARQGELTRAVLASVEVAIVVADPAGHLVMFNDTARRWFGDADPALGPDAHAERYGLYGPDGRTLLTGAQTPLLRVLAEGSVDAVDLLVRTASGDERRVRCTGRRMLADSGELLGAVVALQDVTADREHQDSLQAAHEELARYAGQMRALARASRTVATADDPRTAVCEAVRDLTAADAVYLLQTRTGPDGERLVATASVGIEDDSFLVLDPATERALPLTVLAGGQQLFVADVPSHPDANRRLLTGTRTQSGVWQPVLGADGRPVGVLGVVWQRRVEALPGPLASMVQTLAGEAAHTLARTALLEQLVVAVERDPLTGVGNRRHFDRVVAHEVAVAERTGAPLTFALVDLDHFKRYNDAYGHLIGDDLLRDFARVAGEQLRPGDSISRWGGEEFALVLPGCTAAAAAEVADRIRAAVPHAQTATVGVAQWTPGASAAAVLGHCDEALYRGKGLGRDRTVVRGQVRDQVRDQVPAARTGA
ncbi:diguanylate cyclase [Kineococcus endophyticus]|uniref:Diguanylate cyclase n=1 Tax=Kineococcus endophyticus TaxID=1181883 RepID=A0ABV3P936_9ACTN